MLVSSIASFDLLSIHLLGTKLAELKRGSPACGTKPRPFFCKFIICNFEHISSMRTNEIPT